MRRVYLCNWSIKIDGSECRSCFTVVWVCLWHLLLVLELIYWTSWKCIHHLRYITPPLFQITSLFGKDFLIASSMLAPYMICPMYYQHINSNCLCHTCIATCRFDWLFSEDLDNPHFRHCIMLNIHYMYICVLTSSSYCSIS